MKTGHRHAGGQDFAQQEPEPPEQDAEVVADRGEHGVDGVAGAVSEVTASHAVLGLEVTDHGLDRSTPLELAFDLRCNATLLAGGVDLELVTGRRIVYPASVRARSMVSPIICSMAGMTVPSVWPS